MAPCRAPRTLSSESVARLISKRRAKHSLAFSFIAARASGAVATQRSIKRAVPVRSSFSTYPASSAAISRQMFTLFEIRTGVPQASASTTAIPKFS